MTGSIFAIMCSLGLGSTLVPRMSSANISVNPYKDFRLDRLIIPSDLAEWFLVTDIKVGRESQLNSTACIPGMAFSETSFSIKLKGDIACPGQSITVSVTNQSGEARNFQGVLIGHIEPNQPSRTIANLGEAT